MARPLELEGKQFGRVLVLHRVANGKHGQAMWSVKCQCGSITIVSSGHLTSGHTRSCGCLAKDVCIERSTVHGHGSRAHKSREYHAWRSMKARCYKKSNKDYSIYGGRGITVCEDWVNDFASFFKYMGVCPDNYELDRIDNELGYEPNNVRWSTEVVQGRNTRNTKLSMEKAREIRSSSLPNKYLADIYGVSEPTIMKVVCNITWREE